MTDDCLADKKDDNRWLGGVVIDRSPVRFQAGALPGSLGQLSLPFLLGIGKSSTSLLLLLQERA